MTTALDPAPILAWLAPRAIAGIEHVDASGYRRTLRTPSGVLPYVALTTMPIKGWLTATVTVQEGDRLIEYLVEIDRWSGAWQQRSLHHGEVAGWDPEGARIVRKGSVSVVPTRGFWDRPMSAPARMLHPLAFPLWGRRGQSDQFRPSDVRESGRTLAISFEPLDGGPWFPEAVLDVSNQSFTSLRLYEEMLHARDFRIVDHPSIQLP